MRLLLDQPNPPFTLLNQSGSLAHYYLHDLRFALNTGWSTMQFAHNNHGSLSPAYPTLDCPLLNHTSVMHTT